MKTTVFFLILTVIFISCRQEKSNSFPYEKGKIILLKNRNDSTEQYYAYFPKEYVNDGTYPIIVGFDAHKNGLKFVKKLKFIADKLGIALAGSMNFENNHPQAEYIAQMLFRDIQNRFNINSKAEFIGGFSGGARFAQIYAFQNNEIDGVLSFSAGISFNTMPMHSFPMAITFGKQDFNYREAIYSDQIAPKLKIPLAIFTFNGKHQYPDDTTAAKAVMFLYSYAIKQKWIPKQKNKINFIENFLQTEFKNASDINKFYIAKEAISILNGIANVNKYKKFIDNFVKTQKFKAYISKMNKINSIENKLMSLYPSYFEKKDIHWWKIEIENLHEKITTTKDPDFVAMYSRIKGFLGILAYEKTKQYAYANNQTKLKKALTIYKLLEPNNPDMEFFRALYYKNKKNTDSASFFLNKAINNGFDTTSIIYLQLWK